jgi:Monodechloroaminopyrrolnitrin synthase PrnB
MRRQSLLNSFLEASEQYADKDWYQRNAALFLQVCEAHGETATQHHNQLVGKFIEKPSGELSEQRLKTITASGPPLPVLLSALVKLRDLRTAAMANTERRDDIPSRYADFDRLRESLDQQ